MVVLYKIQSPPRLDGATPCCRPSHCLPAVRMRGLRRHRSFVEQAVGLTYSQTTQTSLPIILSPTQHTSISPTQLSTREILPAPTYAFHSTPALHAGGVVHAVYDGTYAGWAIEHPEHESKYSQFGSLQFHALVMISISSKRTSHYIIPRNIESNTSRLPIHQRAPTFFNLFAISALLVHTLMALN